LESNLIYHRPVLLHESLQGLNIQPQGVYIDLTFGGGGHSQAILSQLKEGKLIAFDQDTSSNHIASEIQNPAFTFIHANSQYMNRFLAFHGINQVDGMLADLGVSSHQIDTPDRGFSTRANGLLDMRMDRNSSLTAKEIINTYSLEKLLYLLQDYGEIKSAYKLANAIIVARAHKPIETTDELKELALPFASPKKIAKFLAQVFQAFRIEVNDELNILQTVLEQTVSLLKQGGRLAVISYHSLEDRLVKRFLKTGNFDGEPQKDIYGNLIRPFKPLYSKPIIPGSDELAANPRSRSAKLRIGERL
jgi:16S rRNA (cytosine1402-N4)-methyltransferase